MRHVLVTVEGTDLPGCGESQLGACASRQHGAFGDGEADVDSDAAQQRIEPAHEPAFVGIRRRRFLRDGRRLGPQPTGKI